MVGVAQLVRAPGCGPGGRGFKSHHSPKFSGYSVVRLTRLLWEQEIGSSNLSTPTLEKYQTSLNKALSLDGAFCFHSLSYLSNIYQIKDTKMKDTHIGVWDSRNERKSSFSAKYLERKSDKKALI